MSEIHKMNIGKSLKGRKLSEIHKKRVGDGNRGKIISSETRIKLSLNAKENTNYGMRGKKQSEEAKIKMSIAKKGKKLSQEHINNVRKSLLGHKQTEKTKEILRLHRIKMINSGVKILSGEKHPNWCGGISSEPYGIEFNNKLKKEIRKRDNFICQECHYPETILKRKLSIHHIDYNKKNNNPNNLISLCDSCHAQTNFERDDWIKYFKEKKMGDKN